ncbi:hypothetical protein [Thiolapillus sp.]|uniref:hypothetical protein n=1 Tax=Thiolapillus sp. TaxID=2017437 RepID=UPI0025DF5428|nr:hypothetical protein [Thiolapillus sp.]
MTRTAGAQIGCQRPSRFWGLGCPKIYHEAEDTLDCRLRLRGTPSGRESGKDRNQRPGTQRGKQQGTGRDGHHPGEV